MAVGNPYGRRAYGTGPYARFGNVGRPYGVGAYGEGLYSIWGANTFEVGGRSGITFAAQALTFRLAFTLHGATGITFDVWSVGMSVTIHPWASTEIVLATTAPLEFSWAGWAPCSPGGWRLPDGCLQGGWTAPGACSEGAWGDVRLEEMV